MFFFGSKYGIILLVNVGIRITSSTVLLDILNLTNVHHLPLPPCTILMPTFWWLQSSGSWDYIVRLWRYDRSGDLDTENVTSLTGHTGNVHSVIFSKQHMLVKGLIPPTCTE